jgi:uncharacterized protein YbaR (Trm112 family)
MHPHGQAGLTLAEHAVILGSKRYRHDCYFRKHGEIDMDSSAIDPELLEILRCPVAVHYKDRGDDPGRLELVKGAWLVCADSGYKYPIRSGIPVMLVDEGAKWKDTAVEDLPVPPPAE